MTRRGWMFFLVGAGLVCLGVQHGAWWCLFLFWLAADFLIIGVAYLKRIHVVFGKRPDGALAWWSWGLFWPYLIYSLLVWHAVRVLSREPAHAVVATEMVVGRRLLPREAPEGIVNYVDLTTEFCEPTKLRHHQGYLNFPMLDGGAPAAESLLGLATNLKAGRTFIHCAQGHGRTGLVALAVLLSKGAVNSIEAGLRLLQSARPGIRLNAEQRECLEEYVRLILKRGAP